MTKKEQYQKAIPRFCTFCGKELFNNRCHCSNSYNEEAQYDAYSGIPLEKDNTKKER